MRKTRLISPSRPHRIVVASGLFASAIASQAATFDTGNEDIVFRWDNTLKYSAGVRAKSRSAVLTEQAVPPVGGTVPSVVSADDGDRNFKRGSLISNRVDMLSELDFIYKGSAGFRVSGAAWYDQVYNRSNGNDSPSTNNSVSVPYNEFTRATRNLHGRKAEILDAFLFGSTDLGSARLSGRLGRHTLLWGESLFFSNNGIAGTQAPVDAIKATSVPASTTKELLMPVNQVSGTLQINDKLSLMAYYQLEWERTRTPAAGSYFSSADNADIGGERALAPVSLASVGRSPDLKAKDGGQGGIGLRTKLGAYDIGVYAVRYHAKTPVGYSRIGATGPTYQLVFPEGIRAFGLSAALGVGMMSYSAEVSVRRGTPLTSNAQVVFPGVVADNNEHPLYAVGNSAHAQVSIQWTLPSLMISQEPSLAFEVALNTLTSCKRNCTPTTAGAGRSKGALDPNTTKSSGAVRFTFTAPQRNVLDGLDLTPSISAGYTSGRSAVAVLGPDRGGDVSLLLGANYVGLWDFSLAYTHYYGPEKTPAFASATPALNGTLTFAQSLRDRNFVAFSVRRTF